MALDNLRDATISLNKSISNFPVGAVSVDDFKPIEERIKDTRKTLNHLNARLLMLKTQNEFQTIDEEPKHDLVTTITQLNNATAHTLIIKSSIKLRLHSYTIEQILAGKQGDHDMQERIYASMRKLFTLNDHMLTLQEEIDKGIQKQLKLKVQCQNALFDYKKFLTEQEEINSKKLKETNPEIAQNKQKINRTIRNINLMKKLIVNFIAASNQMLMRNSILVEMLEKHRELINMETILKMSQQRTERENVEAED